MKSVWVLDDTMVAGRPLHEWVRHVLVEMAAKGASLDQMRGFCDTTGIPARRSKSGYWNSGTFNSLLTTSAVLKYCGHEVWNVHGKRGRERPASEWEIQENARAAIITAEEAKSIQAARHKAKPKRFDHHGRSRESAYLLSGGLFVCGRCGSNMMGMPNNGHAYYTCGSQPYRKGRGCGPGVYVPKEWGEAEAVAGMVELVEASANPERFVARLNARLRQIWEQRSGYNPSAARELEEVERKLANVRQSIEEGLEDAAWADRRLRELAARREELIRSLEVVGEPPQIDPKEALAYRSEARRVLADADPKRMKRLLRLWVKEVRLEPERHTVRIWYRVPYLQMLVAGAGFEPATSGL
jgi:hypothetical protein